ncbi:histone-lysine N-methyltransferase SETMAR [Trichonephila clavipes]|nr:histone-lysine N-methyltransferase SETMAR [Trichonephila clavipes]
MESDKQHFRHILLLYYIKGKNAVQARKKLTDVYGEGVLTVRQCQNWFAKFRCGDFDVEDAPRSGWLDEADKDAIKALVDANRRITTREIGLRLNLSNSTVNDHLKGLGLSSKLDFLSDNTTINSEVYCRQLDKLNDALQQKRSEPINRKGVVFHQDNARPHTSLVTRQKLLQLELDTMPHPPYSPDLSPSDYYLFRSLQNVFDVQKSATSKTIQRDNDLFEDERFRGIYLEEVYRLLLTILPTSVDCRKSVFDSCDEAHFWLNGYVNKQNFRIWSEANPQVYVETPLHPEKLTVWCALWAGGILLQKR